MALDHDDVWRHLAGRPSNAEEYASALGKRLAEGRWVWVVRLLRPVAGLPAGAVVGTTSFLEVSPDDARLEIGATAYTPLVWSTRVNPDTKLQLLSCAFEALGAGRVELKTDVRNRRSQRAIERLGALHEGTLRRRLRRGHDQLFAAGGPQPVGPASEVALGELRRRDVLHVYEACFAGERD